MNLLDFKRYIRFYVVAIDEYYDSPSFFNITSTVVLNVLDAMPTDQRELTACTENRETQKKKRTQINKKENPQFLQF